MEQVLSEIAVTFTDSAINRNLQSLNGAAGDYGRHFNQNEEFFIRFAEPITIPSFPFHHDVRKTRPDQSYLEKLRDLVGRLVERAPDVFAGLTHLFDPAEIHRPAFFRLYETRGRHYLYLLRLDLTFRPAGHEVVERGNNDVTPVYRTTDLILEADLIPLDGVTDEDGRPSIFRVEQSVSRTWIGETGRGYFVQGIWLDRDLSRFFSRLFVPKGKRIYPYFPFTCKYRAVCHSLIALAPEDRTEAVPRLQSAREFLKPHMREIEDALRRSSFSEELAAFQKLKSSVPAHWKEAWSGIELRAYLNDSDMKEFALE